MCHFITAVLPLSANQIALAEIAHKYGRKLQQLANPSVEAQLQAGETYFLTTVGHCDCGTALGARAREYAQAKPVDKLAQERKLKLKGWSSAKISRWMQQQADNQNKQHPKESVHVSKDIETWCALLTEMLGSGLTLFVGLLIHSYSGPLSESFELVGRKAVQVSEIGPDFLGHMEEDTLYEFRNRA